MNNTTNALLYLAVIGGIVLFVVCYAKALFEVKTGRLVVYRDWGDFIKASLWAILIPYGVCSVVFGGSDDGWPSRVIGIVSFCGGAVSFYCACVGAFRYNTGSQRILSLFARFAVTLLLIFALAKLQEKFKQYERGETGLIRGVLLPLLLFGYIFHEFIQPMIGVRYYRAQRMIRDM